MKHRMDWGLTLVLAGIALLSLALLVAFVRIL